MTIHNGQMATVAGLGRLRWAVRTTLALGVAASVAANILHAQPAPIARAIAAWPPLALLLTVELVSRVPVQRRLLGAVRITATVTIAGIAAWVSYWHMTGVAARYGETGTTAYLLPISVDGLIVVASISLVEIAARIHTPPPAPTPATAPAASAAAPASAPLPTVDGSRPDTAAVPALAAPATHEGRPTARPARPGIGEPTR